MNLYKLIKYTTIALLSMLYFSLVESVFAIAVRPIRTTSDGGININDLVQPNTTSWWDFLWNNIIQIHIWIILMSAIICVAYVIIWKFIYPRKVLVRNFVRNISIYFGILIASTIILPLGYAYFEVHITDECLMNGFGQGKCTFTNLGSTKAYKCGIVEIWSNSTDETKASAIFCSGDIASKDTKIVEFTVPGVRDMCQSSKVGGNWSDVCTMNFIEKDR